MTRAGISGRRAQGTVRSIAACIVGPLIWSLHFGLVYAVHHVACRASIDPGALVTPVVIGVTAIAMISLGAASLWPQWLIGSRGRSIGTPLASFLAGVMRWLILLSAVGVLWTWSAYLFVDVCVP